MKAENLDEKLLKNSALCDKIIIQLYFKGEIVMKKKIFLGLTLVAMFVCIFAIGVSATDTKDETFKLSFDVGDKMATDELPLWSEDGYGLVWYVDSENKLVSVKATELTLEYITQAQPYTSVGKLPAVNDAQCLSAIKHGDEVIQSVDGVKKIVVANLRDLSFAYIYEGSKTTLFASNSTLQCLYLPNTVKRLASYCFCNSSALTSLDMGNSVQIIWDYAFAGTALTRLDLSNTCLYVGKYILNHATSIKELHLGNSIQYLPLYWLHGTGKQMIDVYMPTTITNFDAPYNNYITIFFTGSLEEAKTMIPSFGVVEFTYRHYSEFDGLRTTEECKWITYYETNECVAFYKGEHQGEDDGLCTTERVCEACGITLADAPESHDIVAEITYNGYMNAGQRVEACTRCQFSTVEDVPALFTCLGYSASEVGGDGIAIGYMVNNEAISEYTSITGKSLKYGVFVASQSKLGNNDIFDQEGNKASGVVSVEITNYEFVAFELKIVGFTDENKEKALVMGAYAAVTTAGATEYVYMQDAEPDDGEKYSYVTYNGIVNK